MKTKLAIILGMVSSLAQAGVGSHGGNEIELEAWSYARTVANMIQMNGDQFDLNPADAEFFYQVMTGEVPVTVEETSEKLYDDQGNLKTAINIPSKKLIRINRERWAKVEDSSRFGIIAHEFMGASGSTLDLNYRISSQLKPVYREIFQNGSPIYYGGIYHKVSCSDLTPISPKYGNIMLKSTQKGKYSLYIDGIFAQECADPKTDFKETRNLVANETLISKSAPGVVQLWVYQMAIRGSIAYAGSCSIDYNEVKSTLAGNETLYKHVDDPNDSDFEKLFKRALALSEHLQNAVIEGKCTIPFFPGIKTWLNRRYQEEKSSMQGMQKTWNHYQKLKNGTEKIDPVWFASNHFYDTMVMAQLNAEDFKRSDLNLREQPYIFRYGQMMLQKLGYTKQEIVEAAIQLNRLTDLIDVGNLETLESTGVPVALMKANGVSAIEYFRAMPGTGQNDSYFNFKKCKKVDNQYACNRQAFSEFITDRFSPSEVFSELTVDDQNNVFIHAFVKGLDERQMDLAQYIPSNEAGLKLLLNQELQFPYSKFNKVIPPEFLLKYVGWQYFYYYHNQTNVVALLEGQTQNLKWLKEFVLNTVSFHRRVNGTSSEKPATGKELHEALNFYMRGDVKLPTIRKLADHFGLNTKNHLSQFRLHFNNSIQEAVKTGGATCTEIKWMGFDRKQIRKSGVCK